MARKALVRQVEVALQLVDVHDLARPERRQGPPDVGLVVELGALHHHALQAGFHHQQAHHAVLQVLLGHLDPDRSEAGLQVGLFQRLERELDRLEARLGAGEGHHGVTDRGLWQQRIALDLVAANREGGCVLGMCQDTTRQHHGGEQRPTRHAHVNQSKPPNDDK